MADTQMQNEGGVRGIIAAALASLWNVANGIPRLGSDKNLYGVYPASLFGADPSASAATNTAAIQAAIDAAGAVGGVVTLAGAGTYLIGKGTSAPALALNCCLYLRSNIRLSLGKGVVLKKADGANCYTLRNYLEQTELEAASVTSVTVSSSVATVVMPNEVGIPLMAGDTVTIAGATPAGLNGVKTVVATSPTGWTYAAAGVADGAATGTITVAYAVNSNITIEGGEWHHNADGNTTSPLPGWIGHGFWWLRVRGMIERDYTFHGSPKYAHLHSACKKVRLSTLTGIEPHSDGTDFHGPADDVVINDCTYTTGDNSIALLQTDITSYLTTWGNIQNVRVKNCHFIDAHEPVRLINRVEGGYFVRDIFIDGLTGTVAEGHHGMSIMDDPNCVGTPGGTIDRVTIQNVSLSLATVGMSVCYINATGAKSITLRGYRLLSNSRICEVASPAHLVSLTLDDVQADSSAYTGANANNFMQVSGIIDHFKGSNWDLVLDPARSAQCILIRTAGSMNATISNCRITGSNTVIQTVADAGNCDISLVNVHQTNCRVMYSLGGAQKLSLVGCSLSHVGGASLVYVSGAGRSVRVSGSGNRYTAGIAAVTGVVLASSATCSVNNSDFPVPLNTLGASITPNAWDRAFNTEAAHALGVGPVIYNGAAWEKNGRA
jgi:polygalacturonase